jgi:predicted outer membrane repeat protein
MITVKIFGIDVSGIQSGTWTITNSPYHVIGDVTVVSETSLTIEQGVIVNFDLDTKITIYGDLQAIGALNDSIYFQSDYSWHGIKIIDTDTSNLIYCVVSDSDDSGVTISNSIEVLIQYCHIFNNSGVMGGGINIVEGSNSSMIEACKIDYNLISGEESGGGGIAIDYSNYTTVQYCEISNNQSAYSGGGIYVNYCSYTTIGNMNSINDNKAVLGGGISINKGVFNYIGNNVITNNDALNSTATGGNGGGIYLITACNVVGNYISYNTTKGSGGGIYAEYWSVDEKIIYANSIFNNQAVDDGGGIYVLGFPKIRLCDIYSNQAGSNGGGIYASHGGGDMVIDSCYVHHNKALTNTGGGICVNYITSQITRSVISYNEAHEGGGVYIIDNDLESGISNIINSVVYGNKAYEQYAGLAARGESNDQYAVVKCKNSVFYENTVNEVQETDLFIETVTNQSFKSIVRFNCISPNGLQISGDSDEVIVEFNISEDPSFENVGVGNFDLDITSPCIDAGDPDSDEDGEYWTVDEDDQDPDNTRLDIGRYYKDHCGDVKVFKSGIQWISFPHLIQQGFYYGDMYEKVYFTDDEPGLFQLISGGPSLVDGLLIIDGKNKYITYNQGSGFTPYSFGNMLFRHEGYKVEIDEGYEDFLVVDGDLLTTYTLDMPALEDFWLGYYVPYPQNIEQAFRNDFVHVNRIWAEDWYYDAMYIQRGLEPSLPSNSTEGKTMIYGKMYIVQMYENVDNFAWYESGTVEEPTKKTEPENFDYTEKMDYEVIDVISIPENIVEIGVFEEDICVGAVVVEDSCAQILVYSDNVNREGSAFTFEYVSGRGNSTQFTEYLVLDQDTGEFVASEIIAGRQIYSAIKFTDDFKPLENTVRSVKLMGNYPNPFNPETNISFSIPVDQKVKLAIYNLKGQKVKEIINGQFVSGTHSVIWNGIDDNGKQVGSGLYFYKLKTGNKEISKKMLLLK